MSIADEQRVRVTAKKHELSTNDEKAAALDHILALTARKMAIETTLTSDLESDAWERHGAACEELWRELERAVRQEKPEPYKAPSAEEIARQLRKEALAHLRANLPALVGQALEEWP